MLRQHSSLYSLLCFLTPFCYQPSSSPGAGTQGCLVPPPHLCSGCSPLAVSSICMVCHSPSPYSSPSYESCPYYLGPADRHPSPKSSASLRGPLDCHPWQTCGFHWSPSHRVALRAASGLWFFGMPSQASPGTHKAFTSAG